MICRFLCIALLWTVVYRPHRGDDGVRNEWARLEGTWILVKLEVNGKSVLMQDKPEPKMVIKGGKLVPDAKEDPVGEMELSKILDPSRRPKTVTLPVEGRIR